MSEIMVAAVLWRTLCSFPLPASVAVGIPVAGSPQSLPLPSIAFPHSVSETSLPCQIAL